MNTGTLLLLGGIVAASANAAPLPERVLEAAQARVDAGRYPALVIAFVDGERSGVAAFGKLDDGRKPDGDTVFEIGSVTKTFTATLLAQEIESGRLALDTPVADLLGDATVPARGGKTITLRDLADHHSGLPRLPDNLAPADPADPYADYDAEKLLAFLRAHALQRDPGASYEYSNAGYGLLGYALARHAGTTYPALLESRLLKPLDMSMSGVALTEAMRARLAPGHGPDGEPVKNWNFDTMAGAGALRSTGNDMLRYLRANMAAASARTGSAMKLAQQPRRKVDKDERIGLGWMTGTTKSGGIVWHNGMTGGYASALAFSADSRRGVVVLTNIAASADDLAFAALDSDAPLQAMPKAITLDADTLDDYVGDYRLAEKFFINISRDGTQLYAQATGQGAFPIHPSARDAFFADVAGIRIDFRRGADGKVDSLVLHQGDEHVAPRVADAPKAADTPADESADAAPPGDYTGEYELAPGVRFTITAQGKQLHAQLSGQPAYPVHAAGRDHFRYRVVDAQLAFERDAGGRVVALVLHQNGLAQRAKRVE